MLINFYLFIYLFYFYKQIFTNWNDDKKSFESFIFNYFNEATSLSV